MFVTCESGFGLQELEDKNAARIGSYESLELWHAKTPLPPDLLSFETRVLRDPVSASLYLSVQNSIRGETTTREGCVFPPFYCRRYEPLHWGQRKLMLNVVNFLLAQQHEKIVVYVGASDQHMYAVAKLFPDLVFHLYETRDRMEKCALVPNVSILNRFRPATYTHQDDVVLICELPNVVAKKGRTHKERVAASRIFMQKAESNMELQRAWVQVMRPTRAMLKFKLPYPSEASPAFYKYLRGDVTLQPWSNMPSSETRLVVERKQKEQQEEEDVFYNVPLYAAGLDHFNAFGRTADLSSEAFLEGTLGDVWQGFGLPLVSADAAMEAHIWKDYLSRNKKTPDIAQVRTCIERATRLLDAGCFRKNLNFQKARDKTGNVYLTAKYAK